MLTQLTIILIGFSNNWSSKKMFTYFSKCSSSAVSLDYDVQLYSKYSSLAILKANDQSNYSKCFPLANLKANGPRTGFF